jgi:hypothetical protein
MIQYGNFVLVQIELLLLAYSTPCGGDNPCAQVATS